MLEYVAVILLILAIVLMTMTTNPMIHLVSALFVLAVAVLAMYRTYQMVEETRSAVAYVDSETAALSKATGQVFNAQWAVNNGMSSSNAAAIIALNSNAVRMNLNMSSMSNAMALSHSNLRSGLVGLDAHYKTVTSGLQTGINTNLNLVQGQLLSHSNLVRSNMLSLNSNISLTNSNLMLLSKGSENAFRATHANIIELGMWVSNNIQATNSNVKTSLNKITFDTQASLKQTNDTLTSSINKLAAGADSRIKTVANNANNNMSQIINWASTNFNSQQKTTDSVRAANQAALQSLQANLTTLKNDFNNFGSATGGFGILKSDYTNFVNPKNPLVKDSAKLSTLNIQDVTITRIPGATSSANALKVCLGNACGILMTSNMS